MKWYFAFPILALAFFSNACERHPASELPAEHATAFGEHAAPHGGAEKHEAKPAEEHGAAQAEAAAPAPETKPGEAPKFFPEKK
jgi:hypothetical protein